MPATRIQSFAKARSEWVFYAVLLLSGGFFSFVWLVMMMRDINRLEQRTVFAIRSTVVSLSVLLLLYFGLLFFRRTLDDIGFGSFFSRFVIAFIIAITILVILVIILACVYKHAKIALGMSFNSLDVLVILVLSFLMMLSFVLVQKRMNILIRQASIPGRSPI